MSDQDRGGEHKPDPLREIVQPFIDLVHAPRALWGINVPYFFEGMVYFGMLGYLAIHFSEFIFVGVPHVEEWSHNMVMVLTAGITISMFFLGFVGDKWGVRRALLLAFVLMLMGRALISAAPTIFGFEPAGLWSPLHLVTMGGILFVVIGYGMYQPSAYSAVRQFTNPKTAAMGFAMLYALMNFGGWLPTFAFLLRDKDYAGFGIPGTYWVYTAFTVVALLATFFILTNKTVKAAVARAKRETKAVKEEEAAAPTAEEAKEGASDEAAARHLGDKGLVVPKHMWLFLAAIVGVLAWRLPEPYGYYAAVGFALVPVIIRLLPATTRNKVLSFIANHPLADAKFAFFIFALIPVQTLFTYNWLILPQYIKRAFDGWIGDYFEIAANANPIMIFILVPIITALTQKKKVYNMMIWGTLIMAAPAFLLVIGPYAWTLFTYIVIMTVGEAMWQPRFLQYAAEIAPEGRTGTYMGVAQLPWFLTKLLVPLLYSGWMMDRYCPAIGIKDTQTMWLIFGCIAISSTVLLILARGWLGKDFKTRA